MRQHPTGDPIRVRADGEGRPLAFVWNGHPHRVETIEETREPRLDWWAPGGEIHRAYFIVTTDRGLIAEIFRDMPSDAWFVARLFD